MPSKSEEIWRWMRPAGGAYLRSTGTLLTGLVGSTGAAFGFAVTATPEMSSGDLAVGRPVEVLAGMIEAAVRGPL